MSIKVTEHCPHLLWKENSAEEWEHSLIRVGTEASLPLVSADILLPNSAAEKTFLSSEISKQQETNVNVTWKNNNWYHPSSVELLDQMSHDGGLQLISNPYSEW